MNSPDLPSSVRDELRAAFAVPSEERLVAAARMLNQQLALDCSDARELVGLPDGSCA